MLLPALVSNKFNKWSNSFIVNNCVQAIIVIIALLLQLYSHSSGLLLTDDSHHYLAGSHSFKNSSVLVDDDGQYFLFWPPLFPIMLSFLASPGQSLIWINLAVEFCIALAVLNISNQIIQRSWIRILNFAFILLGVHILLISTFLWSELFFLLFAIVFIDQLPRSKKSKSSLYIAIAFGFLMCLQRNAGIFIATAGGIWIFISEISWRQKTLRTLLVFLSVASGVLVWNIYVWFILPHKHFSFSEELFQRLSSNVNSLSYAIINAFIPINFFSFILLIILFSSILFLLRVELKKTQHCN